MKEASSRRGIEVPALSVEQGNNESSELIAEVHSLRKHKEWADTKIALLIKRVRDAEGPQRLLTDEVQQLRLVSFTPSILSTQTDVRPLPA